MIRFLSAALASTMLILAFPYFAALYPGAHPLPAAPETQSAAVTAAHLQALLDSADYIQFARQLPNAVGFKPEQALYFRGTLAYREGRFKDVIDPLVAAVETHNSSLTASQIESAFEIMGQTAAKTFLYSSSAKMYDDIDKLYGTRMGTAVEGIREKGHIASLLRDVPAETAVIGGDFTLRRGAGESVNEYPVSIAGKSFSAQLDTGASVSLLSESTAKRWGVKLLNGAAKLHGYGGGAFTARPAVISDLKIGNAELHNVVVFVTADENLYIAQIKRQTHALLGFPVASALGRVTFSRDGALTVTANPPENSARNGAPMWVGDGSLLVALGTVPVFRENKLAGGTKERLFELDTGSGSTYLTDHYLAENRSRFPGEPPELARLAGAGGVHEIPAYQARKLPLFFGATPVLCTGQHVLTQPQGGEAESYYGVVGQDVLRLFSSYTLDFRNMRLSVVP